MNYIFTTADGCPRRYLLKGKEMKYEISAELMQVIVNILGGLSYNQIHQVMAELLKLKPIGGEEGIPKK
jgi:hypothetical protein